MGFLENLSDIGSEKLADADLVVGVKSGGLKTGLDNVAKEAEAGGQKAASGWNKAFKLAAVGVVGLATAFIGFTVEGIKKADELDAAVGRIGAQVGLTTQETGKLRAGLLDMSTRTQQSVDDLAKSIESVAKAGFNVEDSLRIQEAAAKAATVTHADLGVVTNTVVTAMKAWNIAGKDVGKTTDTLITTVGRSRIDWDALSRIIATAAPIAKDAGVSFNDLNAAIISIGRSGIPARRAASGVIALIRNMSSPAAQKEMALLGLTVNKTTIAHDGLLLTLQKMEKASGKQVSVLVRNKKGQIDYEKSLAATKKANQGALQAMQAMTGGAAGLVTADILLANGAKDYKEGQDALNDSLGKTNEEFDKVKEADLSIQLALIRNQITRFAIDLGTQVLPYVAQFLGWLTIQLPLALKGIGTLWETTLKAPVTAMVKSFTDMAKVLGDALFGWGSSGATGARSGIVTFFSGLAELVASLAKDIGGVFDVIKNILELPFAGAAVKGLVFLGIVRTLVSLLPALSRAITGKFLGGLNFLTGGVFKLGGAGGAAGDLGTQATTEAAAKTSEAAAKTGEAATKLGESSAESATKLGEAAAKLSEAAVKMAEAAEASKLGGEAGIIGGGEGINAAEAIRNQTYVESTIAANEATVAAAEKAADAQIEAATATARTDVITNDTMAGVAQSQQAQTVAAETAAKSRVGADRAQTAAVEKQSTAVIAAAEKQETAVVAAAERAAVVQAATAEEAGLAQSAGALAGLKGRAGSALGSAGGLIGGLISKAVVPLLVAQLATDILKAPIGGYIADSFGKKRLGEKIKEDFFGGMIAAFSVVTAGGGSDAGVGRADTTTLANMKFKTMTLGKLGITSATFDLLEAPEGTIDHAIGAANAASVTGAIPDRAIGESVVQYFLRIREKLNTELQVELGKYGGALSTMDNPNFATDPGTAKLKAAFTKTLADGIGKQVSDLQDWTKETLVDALTPVVEKSGYSRADLEKMSGPQLKALAESFKADTESKLGFVQDYLITTALKGDVTPTTSAQRAAVSGPTKARMAALAKAFGKNWQKNLAALLPTISGPVDDRTVTMPTYTPAQKKAAQALAKMFGGKWQDVLRDTFNDIASTAAANKGAPGRARTAAEEALKKKLVDDGKAELEATRKFFATLTPDVQDFMAGFSRDLSALDPSLVAKLNAKFHTTGTDWIEAFRNGTDKVIDPKQMAAIIKVLGPKYGSKLTEMLTGAGKLAFEAGGGAAGATLRKDLAAAIAHEISLLTPKELTTPGKQTESAKTAAKDRKLVTDFLSGAKGTAALANAISTDGTKAKKGLTDLGTGLAKAIPDPAARARFIDSVVAMQKAAQTPGLSTVTDVFKSIPSTAQGIRSVGDEIETLGTKAWNFLKLLNAPGAGGGPGGRNSGRRPGPSSPAPTTSPTRPPGKGRAAGGLWDTNSVTHGMMAGSQVTYGEAGNEFAAVISHPKTASWASILGNVGSTSRLPGTLSSQSSASHGGPHQEIHVDHMHIQSQPDETAILETLEFMAPGGIA